MDYLILLADVPICAMDREPGPKLRQGDGKTPEGFYTGDFGFWSRYWWMWMDVGESTVDNPGSVGRGSAFKICLNYPNVLDRKRSLHCGVQRPGSEICVHGNCVTAGCVSFENRDFLPVFACAMHHDRNRFGPLQVHLFPFRFEKWSTADRRRRAREFVHANLFQEEELLGFWDNLEEGWSRFNEKPAPLAYRAVSKLELGDRGSMVKALKVFLTDLGFEISKRDGQFDEGLSAAVKTIQTQGHLEADGIVGRRTMKHLKSLGFQEDFGYAFR
jgi:hypothetical protein